MLQPRCAQGLEQFIVRTLPGHEVTVKTRLHDFSFLEDDHTVCVRHSGKPVGNNNAGFSVFPRQDTSAHLQKSLLFKNPSFILEGKGQEREKLKTPSPSSPYQVLSRAPIRERGRLAPAWGRGKCQFSVRASTGYDAAEGRPKPILPVAG